jgi:hypothetical protein
LSCWRDPRYTHLLSLPISFLENDYHTLGREGGKGFKGRKLLWNWRAEEWFPFCFVILSLLSLCSVLRLRAIALQHK